MAPRSAALIDRARATELLGTMLGGYNISPMVDLLDDAAVAARSRRRPEENPADVRPVP